MLISFSLRSASTYQSSIAVGRPVARTAPAQIPACRFLAPGSSETLASASGIKRKNNFSAQPSLLLLAVRLALLIPVLHRRTMFPLPASCSCPPLPLVIGATIDWERGALPGNRFGPLAGDRKGQYSIRINDQWRICFEWSEKSPGPLNVEIVDCH